MFVYTFADIQHKCLLHVTSPHDRPPDSSRPQKKRASKNTHFDDGDTRLQTSRKTQHKNDIYEKSGYRISLSYHSENIKLIFAAERSLRFFLSLARITFQSTSDFISDYSFLCTWVLCLFVFNLMTLLRLRFCFGSFDSSRCISACCNTTF